MERVDPKRDMQPKPQPWASASQGRAIHWRYLTDMVTVHSEQSPDPFRVQDRDGSGYPYKPEKLGFGWQVLGSGMHALPLQVTD